MIHYTCDGCKRPLDTNNETRYVVRVEVYASLEPESECEDEADHLAELQNILEAMDDADDPDISDQVYHHAKYDLCSECRQRYVKNPLGRALSPKLNFSQN
jgi:uncharacterized protein YlaI